MQRGRERNRAIPKFYIEKIILKTIIYKISYILNFYIINNNITFINFIKYSHDIIASYHVDSLISQPRNQ